MSKEPTKELRMKYTIEGFSQSVLVEHGLDATDAVLLRWFIDWFSSGKMETVINEGKEYAWIKYEKVIASLPILGITTPKNIGKRLKKLTDAGILDSHLVKRQRGTNQYYRTGKNYAALIEGRTDARAEGDKRAGDFTQDANVPCAQDANVPSAQDAKVPSYSSVNNSSSQHSSAAADISQESREEEEKTGYLNIAMSLLTTRGVHDYPSTRDKVGSAFDAGLTIDELPDYFEYLLTLAKEDKKIKNKEGWVLSQLPLPEKLERFREANKPEPELAPPQKTIQEKWEEDHAGMTEEEIEALRQKQIEEFHNTEIYRKMNNRKQAVAV